jgi:hypothetical protein
MLTPVFTTVSVGVVQEANAPDGLVHITRISYHGKSPHATGLLWVSCDSFLQTDHGLYGQASYDNNPAGRIKNADVP